MRSTPDLTDTRGHWESAPQLRGPAGRPQRAAAPLNPKALSHEETPCPPPRQPPPSTRPHARGHVTCTAPGPRSHGAGEGGPADRLRLRAPLAATAGTTAPPCRTAAAALTSGDAIGPVRSCGTDGPAGGGGGPARRGTRGHVRTTVAASREERHTRGPLIKPGGAAPGWMRNTCVAPPGPPPPPRPFQRARPRLGCPREPGAGARAAAAAPRWGPKAHT